MPRRRGSDRPPPTPLIDHLRWLESIGSKPCSCRFAWKSLSWVEPGPGRIRRSAGYGWVRQNTDPRCPEHGADVADDRAGVPAAGVVARRDPAVCCRCHGPVDEDRWCPRCMDYSRSRRVRTIHLPGDGPEALGTDTPRL
jgi:hypothetical protein